uniref:TIP41-like protein n=1 Tax=Steinernema glaseri TaxID=37863 RepID=A0A1I7YHI2_9BILA
MSPVPSPPSQPHQPNHHHHHHRHRSTSSSHSPTSPLATSPVLPKITVDALHHAMASARAEENFLFDHTYQFVSVSDHILNSQCTHSPDDEAASTACNVCIYGKELELVHLPEMIFPNNTLTITAANAKNPKNTTIQFNALDALKRVDAHNLPNVQVGVSKEWQKKRTQISLDHKVKDFDWTYTSDYDGTIGDGFKVSEAKEGERIDMERLKRQEPIHFYSQLTLYEDELADHGCTMMNVRVRCMPTSFFVLCRFYLRVDGVMVRVCDTRLFGERGSEKIIREWTRREAKYSELSPAALDVVLDSNQIWQMLPIVESRYTTLTFDRS